MRDLPVSCMTMGTAAMMAALAEALGLTLPGACSIPAVDSNHIRMAIECGERIVELVCEDFDSTGLLTKEAFENAITVDMAIGRSTDAIFIWWRCGHALPLTTFDAISKRVPVLANIRPSGSFLMEDFYYAGGIRPLMSEIGDLLHLDRLTVNGRAIRENLEGAQCVNMDVIRPCDRPLAESGGAAILFGNLAPDGAVIKTSAADPRLLTHTGPAVVFHNYCGTEERLNREDLDVSAESVMVLQNAGPLGGPGMPEWGMLPIAGKLLRAGVRDIVRIWDARMSGTSYGTCVLHVSPESSCGGPLAFVQDGDLITLDVPNGRLDLNISEEEMLARRSRWTRPCFKPERGHLSLCRERVNQAHEAFDFDFLCQGAEMPEPEIH